MFSLVEYSGRTVILVSTGLDETLMRLILVEILHHLEEGSKYLKFGFEHVFGFVECSGRSLLSIITSDLDKTRSRGRIHNSSDLGFVNFLTWQNVLVQMYFGALHRASIKPYFGGEVAPSWRGIPKGFKIVNSQCDKRAFGAVTRKLLRFPFYNPSTLEPKGVHTLIVPDNLVSANRRGVRCKTCANTSIL